ncbi:histidine phosphotransferase [Rhodobacteraceae bacterium WD3A24]|nr:histidine phosphotransferase [Rhodobacteraceae bacterium WD3A24]
MSGAQDLAALIGSRICHDLVSPLGAIGNGVELLSMAGSAPAAELELISESVAAATARLELFRVAFGAAGPGQQIGPREIRALLPGLGAGGRLEIDWEIETAIERQEARLVLLLLMCVESALPRGGRVSVTHQGGTWEIVAQAARVNADPELWSALDPAAPQPEASAAQVHFLLVGPELERQQRPLTSDIGAERIRLRF